MLEIRTVYLFLPIIALCSSFCSPPPASSLRSANVDTVVIATVLSYDKSVGYRGEVTAAVDCRFMFEHQIADQIIIRVAPPSSKKCSNDLDEGSQLVFYLTSTSQPNIYYTDVSLRYDGYAPVSDVDIVALRQLSYAIGIMPTGKSCPEDCVTGSDWSEWSECSKHCGVGSMYRHLQSSHKTEGGARCPIIPEPAQCNIRPCDAVVDPLDNADTKTNAHMIVGKCQTVDRVEHVLCTKLCEVGYENRPLNWTVTPVRVLCDRQTIKFKNVMIISECSCVQVEDEDFDPFDFFG